MAMDRKSNRAQQEKAAAYIAALMQDSLAQFPKECRTLRLKQSIK
jgi:hypothetical protein